MAGEASVKSGEFGQNIMEEFLRLVGWSGLPGQFNFDCNLSKKHKSKGDKENEEFRGRGRKTHGIDNLYFYDSPLEDQKLDIVLCSSKHHQGEYSKSIKSDLKSHLKELSESLECAKRSYSLKERIQPSPYKKKYNGVLFWLSSGSPKEMDIISSAAEDVEIKSLCGPEPIYVLDNSRATFLYSAIRTAQYYYPNKQIKFLYHNTGRNNEASTLLLSGKSLPVQLINSPVVPIIINDAESISSLIFCNEDFDKNSLKRLIWLVHKLVGLTNEIVIFFNKYDPAQYPEAQAIKSIFKDSDFTERIKIKQATKFDFVTLKETEPNQLSPYSQSATNTKISYSNKIIDENLDMILPFGEMLIPKLSSPVLTEAALNKFLRYKGIFIGVSEKQYLMPIFRTLLLSPLELNYLKDQYITKIDKEKTIERKVALSDPSVSLKELLSNLDFDDSIMEPTLNSKLLQKPEIKFNNKDNSFEIQVELRKENPTKDLLTGVSQHSGCLKIVQKEDCIYAYLTHTASETKTALKKMFSEVESHLRNEGVIQDSFESIKFSDFSNESRILFFLGLMDTTKLLFLKEGRLESIRLKPDISIEISPRDIASMQREVSNLSINSLPGKSLDNIHYITDHKPLLLCEKVKIGYDFEVATGTGKCAIEFSFPNAFNGFIDAELQTSITIYETKGGIRFSNSSAVRDINKDVEILKNRLWAKYSTVKEVVEPVQD